MLMETPALQCHWKYNGAVVQKQDFLFLYYETFQRNGSFGFCCVVLAVLQVLGKGVECVLPTTVKLWGQSKVFGVSVCLKLWSLILNEPIAGKTLQEGCVQQPRCGKSLSSY